MQRTSLQAVTRESSSISAGMSPAAVCLRHQGELEQMHHGNVTEASA